MPAPALHILVVDDEPDFVLAIETLLLSDGFHVTTAPDGAAAIHQLQTGSYDLVLLDVRMPRVSGMEVLRFITERVPETQAIMLTGVTDVRQAVECMQLGAFSYLTKPPSSDELLSLIGRALERKRLLLENDFLRSELQRHAGAGEIVGHSRPILDLLDVATRVAATESTVLIQGPSGSGKELIANLIHRNSTRKERPFIPLNCAAVPESLIESELFGHEKGAFTDAVAQRRGLVEVADGGTLFLDEIGELSTTVQPKMLRFLQTGEYRRVGGNQALSADVRVISASNKDLRQAVAGGRFREDLLYRVNVITLEVPALRNRKEDIPALTEHFLRRKATTAGVPRIDARAQEMLMQYDWPGNVRELENVLERASILCIGGMIRPQDIALPIGSFPTATSSSLVGSAVSMHEVERAHIQGVLDLVGWNKTTAAQVLGISLKTLYTKITTYDLTKE
ncbi:MAG: sigma-54 dependent transcriptional regulator [Bacteroidota bacterium]